MGFGFGPNDGSPDFEALLKQFSEMGVDANTLAGAKSFLENMQSPNEQNLITVAAIREIAKQIITAKGDLPVGQSDQQKLSESLKIANTWLDAEILFPASNLPTQSACSKRDWLDNTISSWQHLFEPLALGMADALSNVISSTSGALPVEFMGSENNSPQQQEMMLSLRHI